MGEIRSRGISVLLFRRGHNSSCEDGTLIMLLKLFPAAESNGKDMTTPGESGHLNDLAEY